MSAFASKYPGVVQRLVVCDTIAAHPPTDIFGPLVNASRAAANLEAVMDWMMMLLGKEWQDSNLVQSNRLRKTMTTTSLDGFETCCLAPQSDEFDLRPRTEIAGKGVKAAFCAVDENDLDRLQTMEEVRGGLEKGVSI